MCWIALWMASLVISEKTIRLTGTFGFNIWLKCQPMLSPSRSSSVARISSEASLRASLSWATIFRLSLGTTYSGSKSCSTLTPSEAQDFFCFLISSGISEALAGRSRTCPMLAITVYSRPRYPPILRALAGDSTTTKPLFFFTATKSFLLARRGLLSTGVGLVSGLSTAKMRGDCLSEGCAN